MCVTWNPKTCINKQSYKVLNYIIQNLPPRNNKANKLTGKTILEGQKITRRKFINFHNQRREQNGSIHVDRNEIDNLHKQLIKSRKKKTNPRYRGGRKYSFKIRRDYCVYNRNQARKLKKKIWEVNVTTGATTSHGWSFRAKRQKRAKSGL